jgi:pimeloyl-ACP methyl ester carboxylesterase
MSGANGAGQAAQSSGGTGGLNSVEQDFGERRLAFFRTFGMEAVTGRMISDREGRPVHVIEHGQGTPVVFVHGGLGQAGDWGDLVAQLPAGIRAIMPDRPGCGLSYRLDFNKVNYRECAADFVADVLDGLGLERAIVAGCSMGGFHALAFALKYPERAERLLLLGAPAGIDWELPGGIRAMANPLLGRLIFALIGKPKIKDMRKSFADLVHDVDKLSDDFYELMAEGWALPGASDSSRTMLSDAVKKGRWNPKYWLRDELPNITAPTLFLRGDKDKFAPPGSGQDAAAKMRNARCEVMAGCGHIPWHDDPARFGERVARLVLEDAPAASERSPVHA